MKRFENQVAVVTGGNSGIGRAAAERLAAEGASVVLFGRNPKTLGEVVAAIGAQAIGVEGDVTSPADLERLFATVRQRHGRIDVLFANAGVAEFAPVEAADEAHFDRHFDINVKGTFRTIQGALPLLAPGASVVLNTSVVSHVGFPNASVYSATKAAVRSFARTLSAELAPRGIRVNAVAPGPVDTPIFSRMGIPDDQVGATKQGLAAGVPAKRMGTPEEVAAAVAFLAAKESAYVVGAELSVAGGLGQI